MIVAGFGFRGRATAQSLADALAMACRDMGDHIDCVATAADKADHAAFQALAMTLKAKVRRIDAHVLHEVDTITHSETSILNRNTGSVAEAAALAAAGPGAELLSCRVISQDRLATCALAKGHAI